MYPFFQAAEICNTSGDRAACYHLARQYENNEQFKEAIHFFTRAGAYGNAIRLSKVISAFYCQLLRDVIRVRLTVGGRQ